MSILIRFGMSGAIGIALVALGVAMAMAQTGKVDKRDHRQTKLGNVSQLAIEMARTNSGQHRIERTKRETIEITGPQNFWPPKVQGDREFGGNGPKVTIKARFYSSGNKVYRQIFMRAAETSVTAGIFTSNPSVASGWSRPQVVYTAPAGWTVKPFRRTDHRFNTYVDRNHLPEGFDTPFGRVVVYGDTKGDDIGHYTHVFVNWNATLNFTLISHPSK